MNTDQISGILRAIFAAVGGWLVSKGVVDAEIWAMVSGALVTLAVAGWSWYVHKQSTKIATVNAMPDVKGVITNNTQAGRELAASVPSTTVAPAGTAQATAVAT